ncbi:MAG: hypothetical protein V4620_09600 [Bacteroidota bacterium]
MKAIKTHICSILIVYALSLQICFAQQAPGVNSFVNITHNGNHLFLGDRIAVQVNNLDSLLSLQNDTGTLLLYLDGIAMTGIKANAVDISSGYINFTVTRNDNNDPWDIFYVSPAPKYWKKDVSLSIGYYQTGAITTQVNKVSLVIIRKGYFWVSIACILIILALFIYANKRGLLKDISTQLLKDKPYSLGRSQLAFWTLIVSVSYVFIALVTGELAPLSTSTLILLGISGATTAAAGIIDQNDVLSNKPRSQSNNKTEGFITDVLSDANGMSVHRFQMLVFNLLLGLFFIKQVFTQLQMPDFDDNLLLLMGLSNSTYAGLKINENASAAAASATPANTQTSTDNTTTSGTDDEDVPAIG